MSEHIATGIGYFATGLLKGITPGIARKKRANKLAKLYAKVNEGFKDPSERAGVIAEIQASGGTVTREMIQGTPDISWMNPTDDIKTLYKNRSINEITAFQMMAKLKPKGEEEELSDEYFTGAFGLLSPEAVKRFKNPEGLRAYYNIVGRMRDQAGVELTTQMFGFDKDKKPLNVSAFREKQIVGAALMKGKPNFSDWKQKDFLAADQIGWTRNDIMESYGLNPDAIAGAQRSIRNRISQASISLAVDFGGVRAKWMLGEAISDIEQSTLDEFLDKNTGRIKDDVIGKEVERNQRLEAKYQGVGTKEFDEMLPIVRPIVLDYKKSGTTKQEFKKLYEDGKTLYGENLTLKIRNDVGVVIQIIPFTEEMYNEVLKYLDE